jgi:hypothetical protein
MKTLSAKYLLIAALWCAVLAPCRALLDQETDTFITRDPTGMADGPNEYAYVHQNPWSMFDPDGLSGVLLIESDASDKQQGFPGSMFTTGTHSWVKFIPDDNRSPMTFGTFGNANGAQHKKGVNKDTELSDTANYTRSAHLDDDEEKQFLNYVDKQQKKGADAWTLKNPCSSFAASAWTAATGEPMDPRHGTYGVSMLGSSTPNLLAASIYDANGGKNNGTLTASAKNDKQTATATLKADQAQPAPAMPQQTQDEPAGDTPQPAAAPTPQPNGSVNQTQPANNQPAPDDNAAPKKNPGL